MLAQTQSEIKEAEPPPLPRQKPLPQEAASSSRPFSGVTGFKSEADILAGRNAKRESLDELPEAKGRGKDLKWNQLINGMSD